MEEFTIPEQVTKKLYLFYNPEMHNITADENDFRKEMWKDGSFGQYIYLGEAEVTFDIQKIDIRSEIVKALEAEKEKIKAETYIRLQAVQHKIDNLLQITYQKTEE